MENQKKDITFALANEIKQHKNTNIMEKINKQDEALKLFGGYTKEELEAEGWVITDEAWQNNQFRNYVGYHETLGIVVEYDGNIVIE